jgi:ferredoxin
MNNYILHKENLIPFLKLLATERLIAPVAKAGHTSFEEIKDPEKVALDLDDYTASPKKVMFPQTESLFAFRVNADNIEVSSPENEPTTIIFGIRPCDARSFMILDPLFKGDFNDPYYIKRRENTIIIGLACKEPTERCFCPSLGGNPSGQEGLDMLFTAIGDEYFVEGITDRTKNILSQAQSFFSDPNDEQTAKKETENKDSLEKIDRHIDLKDMHTKLPRTFEKDIWSDLANKCIGCGICTYYCPTCHCFDIQDEGAPSEGRRIRVWDACMFAEFTEHASGVNPRPTRSERLRNRMLHKFSYYPENLGYIACVGCGRCIELCPVNEDLIEILNKLREADG